MKATRQFLPLVQQMLGFHRYGPLPLLAWLGVTTAILFFSSSFVPVVWRPEGSSTLLPEGEVVLSGLLWFFLMVVGTPLLFLMVGGIMSLEFLFTRAIDRGLWVRAQRTAVIIFAIGPLLLNLATSPWQPELAFDPAPPVSPTASVQARYLDVFPGSHLAPGNAAGSREQLIIRHGTEMVAAWLVWSGLAIIFLVGAYYSWVFGIWQRAGWHHRNSKWRPWLGALMIWMPILMPICLVLGCALLHINLYEESFLLFASHPVGMVLALTAVVIVIQPATERDIKKLEFEFF